MSSFAILENCVSRLLLGWKLLDIFLLFILNVIRQLIMKDFNIINVLRIVIARFAFLIK